VPVWVNAAVPAGSLYDRAALGNGHARGLLGVNVLAGPHGHDRGERMPPIARGNEQGVNVGTRGEELAHVRVHLAIAVAVLLVDQFLDMLAPHLPHVADGHELDVLLRQHPAQIELTPSTDSYST